MSQRFKPVAASDTDRRPVRFLKLKLGLLLLLCALPVYGLIATGLGAGSWLPSAIYPLMSLLTFALYGYDKKQARHKGQRTPEKILHAAELLGGWPGALVGQQVFRHKTRKLSYQWVFWLIVMLHELFWIDRVLMGGTFLTRHFY
ncbi:DUF1294 domain-containing protein [Pseudomonas sp. LP_7_YM]|uniref:DUF1294 domain-containing protein n=1 Tax=Pseudomonas sp. LP_7_YM TaxID=2485137 RepID=UPI00105B3607|nr:DUF1294 domain-containing protein [Pseudomonas sp. LP_7_YM]TDV72391.1 uncharacterized membrane protein YsdA (DUF1294 family) [Pseudomonas sp. LP_7_YM]